MQRQDDTTIDELIDSINKVSHMLDEMVEFSRPITKLGKCKDHEGADDKFAHTELRQSIARLGVQILDIVKRHNAIVNNDELYGIKLNLTQFGVGRSSVTRR